MLTPTSPPQTPAANPDQVGRISQIIVGALISGQVMFGAVAAMLRLGKLGEIGLIANLGAGFASLMGVMVALMALTFPSQSQFEAWAEQVQRDHS
jgi:hypothetical protein